MKLFEVLDKTGRIIYLTSERWKHIVNFHPRLTKGVDDIIFTLQNPSIIKVSIHRANIVFYYSYYKNLNSKARYLLVVVKHLNGKGFVLTSYYVDKVKEK